MTSYTLTIKSYNSPVGELLIGECTGKICLCDWVNASHFTKVIARLQKSMNAELQTGDSRVIQKACRQLDQYFAGDRREFEVPLAMAGTEFQQGVWKELLKIPYGCTTTYAALADRIGRPTATRAVANAVGANAMSILIPCHRIIGSDGSLTGYAGGLAAKQHLLLLESTK